ncbi:hypothetical protein QWJ07_17930 [Frankia sp. RB7]|nr:hypothetical protein [Frankia sp. RB7]
MTTDELDKRQAIIDACRRMNALGINQGTSGNRPYHGCLQTGEPPLLSSAEIERVRHRMAGYGMSEG